MGGDYGSSAAAYCRGRPHLVHLGLFIAVYILTGGLGQGLALIPGVSIIFWPPAGVFTATLILNPKSTWPWWVTAGCIAELTCNAIWFHNGIPFALIYYTANALEALTAAWLVHRFIAKPSQLESLGEIAAFVVLCAGLAPVVGATIIGITDALLGKHSFITAWFFVWLGDGTGLLVSAPLTLVVVRAWRERGDIPIGRLIEATAIGVVLVGLGVLAVRGYLPTVYMMMPALLWSAVRFQLKGAATALALTTLLTAAFTMAGRGEFSGDPSLLREKIVMLQTFLGISAVSALLVGALSTQHQRALRHITTVNTELESRVAARTANLQESEERLRLFIENAPAAIAMFDNNMRYLAASHRWISDYRLNGNLIGCSHYDIIPEIPERWREAHRRGLAGEAIRSAGDAFERADGAIQWLKWEILPWRTAAGEIGGILISSEDITASKIAAQDLEIRNRQLDLLTRTSQQLILGGRPPKELLETFFGEIGQLIGMEMFYHYRLGEEPSILQLDTSGGITDEERNCFATMRLGELLCGRVAKQRRPLIIEDFASSFQPGSELLVAAGAKSYAGFPLLVRDTLLGTLAFVSRHPTHFRTGDIQMIQTLCDQIATTIERGRLLQELKQSDERLSLAVTGAHVGLFQWEVKTGRALWSQEYARLLGVTPVPDPRATTLSPGYSYQQWRDRVHPEDLKSVEEAIIRSQRERALMDIDYRIVLPQGDVRWLSMRGLYSYDSDGTPDCLLGIAFDITSRKKAEESLLDADRRKDEFLATLAHELRNPLAPVRNAVQVLQVSCPTVPTMKWATDVIDRQTQAMTRLVDDLLDVSRISRGKLELKRERIELAKIMQMAIETSRPLIDEMNHTLTVDLPPCPLYLNADVTRLAQVFLNLLNNAAKYMEPGGQIEIFASQESAATIEIAPELESRSTQSTATPFSVNAIPYTVVSIRDTGIGIPPDKLSQIFEMFSQVENTLSRSEGGLGIGLSLVKRLVEMHGGTVEARSTGRGKGSTFIVRLPLTAEHAEVRFSDNGHATEQTRDLRIVVVDDNRDTAESLAMLLRMHGNHVMTAYDGESAIQIAEDYRPHAVFCDIGLPKFNGYEVCRRIRQSPWGKEMTLVAITGWGQDGDRRSSQQAGFNYHLVKPVEPRSLLQILLDLSDARTHTDTDKTQGHPTTCHGT